MRRRKHFTVFKYVISTPRCLVPESDGTESRRLFREELWGKFYTGAPTRQRRSVEQYSGVKRA